MCGILGFLRLSGEHNSASFYDWLTYIAERSMARGPDAMGMVSFELPSGRKTKWHGCDLRAKQEHAPTAFKTMLADIDDAAGMSANFRGIPTTEQFGHAKLSQYEIQPFQYANLSVAHNGLLSNDKALRRENVWDRLSASGTDDIDSYIFLNAAFNHDMRWALENVKGSWALALIDHVQGKVMLSRTFLGLHLCILTIDGSRYLVWASEPFDPLPRRLPFLDNYFTWEMAPHSYLLLDLVKLTRSYRVASSHGIGIAMQDNTQPLDEYLDKGKVAVIISGGLDSTVAATMACQHSPEVHFLHFHYGQRAEQAEYKAVQNIAAFLRRAHNANIVENYIDLSFLKTLGGSTLTEHHLPLAHGERGIETAHEWVPARNLVMASMAAAYCDRHDIREIALGTNREESAVYNDNSSEFHDALNRTLALCTRSRPVIRARLEHMMKHHIYAAGRKLSAPIHLSWSCYDSGDATDGLHCGVCDPCLLRKTTATMNNMRDCISYAS